MLPYQVFAGIISSVSAYAVLRALQLDGAGYLSRTPASTTDTQNFTIAAWVTRTGFGSYTFIWEAGYLSQDSIYFHTDNSIVVGCGGVDVIKTQAVYRDTAPMHVCLRVVGGVPYLYVNGEEVDYATHDTTARTWKTNNSTYLHKIGFFEYNGDKAKLLFADYQLVDGEGVIPDGKLVEVNNGHCNPIKYQGDYGTNGFWLKFEEGAEGTDSSGNGNTWTINGTVTSILNTPTDVAWTFNTLHEAASGTVTKGNSAVSGTVHQVGTVGMTAGSYAWQVSDSGSGGSYGIESEERVETTYTASASDTLEFELNCDYGTLDVRVNGGSSVSVATGLSGTFFPLVKAPCEINYDFMPADSSFKELKASNVTPSAITSGSSGQDKYVWCGGACTSVTWNGVTYYAATHDRSVIEFYATGFIAKSGGSSVAWSAVVPNPIGGTVMPRGQSN